MHTKLDKIILNEVRLEWKELDENAIEFFEQNAKELKEKDMTVGEFYLNKIAKQERK
jgi:hypothetical protein